MVVAGGAGSELQHVASIVLFPFTLTLAPVTCASTFSVFELQRESKADEFEPWDEEVGSESVGKEEEDEEDEGADELLEISWTIAEVSEVKLFL